jgi:pseudaminic acid biosynthesis-associated methylase
MRNKKNVQINYWANNEAYIKRNSKFNKKDGAKEWKKILNNYEKKINSILECGSNIGINIQQINFAYPKKKISLIELNARAYQIAIKNKFLDKSYNGSILDCDFKKNSFDLVFTSGVLIHINPKELKSNLKKILSFSKKYLLVMEYFSKKPEMIKYRGKKNLLFKRDFGGYVMDNFNVKILETGFLWSRRYKDAKFDDLTYWLFEKK